MRLIYLLAACTAFACSGGPATGPDSIRSPARAPYVVRTARISILSATIGPCKRDGTQWDGPGHASNEVMEGITDIVAAIAAVHGMSAGAAVAIKVAKFLASPAVAALSKPDPYGVVDLIIDDARPIRQDLAPRGRELKDTFTPVWLNPPTWIHVPLVAGLRIRVTILDEDLSQDDPIGVAEINANDILEAIAAGQQYEINAHDPTGQLLLVAISAVPDGP